jgi:hypothetical protein
MREKREVLDAVAIELRRIVGQPDRALGEIIGDVPMRAAA